MATNDYIEKDLGIVTAYGEAVAGGYTGTREEFQALLVRMASNILDYNEQSNKPQINGVTLQGNKTTSDLGISTVTSYGNLTGKPSINGVTLQGNKTASELGIQYTLNTSANDGYVLKGSGNSLRVWATDVDGKPSWRQISNATATVTQSIDANTNTLVEFSCNSNFMCASQLFATDYDVVLNYFTIDRTTSTPKVKGYFFSRTSKTNVDFKCSYLILN